MTRRILKRISFKSLRKHSASQVDLTDATKGQSADSLDDYYSGFDEPPPVPPVPYEKNWPPEDARVYEVTTRRTSDLPWPEGVSPLSQPPAKRRPAPPPSALKNMPVIPPETDVVLPTMRDAFTSANLPKIDPFVYIPYISTGLTSPTARNSKRQSVMSEYKHKVFDQPPRSPVPRSPGARGDDMKQGLKDAWKQATAKEGGSMGVVDATLTTVETLYNESSVVRTVMAPVISQVTTLAEPVLSAAENIVKGVPALMKVLDSVAQIHPFVGLAVGAFKVVYSMEMTRKQNDAKILALQADMRDMMAVLCQLESIKDPESMGPDGKTIKSRLEDIVEKTANDIKACANACDTYSKKKLVVKVLMSNAWDGKLAAFSTKFQSRKTEFEFALSIHTAATVDKMNDAVNRSEKKQDEMREELNNKLDMMTKMFAKMMSPEQQKLQEIVDKTGGATAFLNNDDKLRSLSKDFTDAHAGGSKGSIDVTALKRELGEDVSAAMEKNMEKFAGKFEIMATQLKRDMELLVTRESDRVIETLMSGPQNKIVDKDVHALWVDMGWRGSVKGRHFVLALRDYYVDRAQTTQKEGHDADWALEYIDFSRLRHILEAFDDDFSGFVTVGEVNQFTRSRPPSWDLPDWIAWWSVGWQLAMAQYVDAIDQIFRYMFTKANEVLPINRTAVNDYLSKVWWRVYTITQSFESRPNDEASRRFAELAPEMATATKTPRQERKTPERKLTQDTNSHSHSHSRANSLTARSLLDFGAPRVSRSPSPLHRSSADSQQSIFSMTTTASPAPQDLQSKFIGYMDEEERRLKEYLDHLRWDIDAMDTVELLLGPNRIEKVLLPLLYLLLRRHLEIICLCTKDEINKDELWHAGEAILYIFDAVIARHARVEEIFIQQKLDIKQSFNRFACGMFEMWHDRTLLWTPGKIDEMDFDDRMYPDEVLPDPDPEVVLRHGRRSIEDNIDLDYSGYETPEPVFMPYTKVPRSVASMLGRWNFVIYENAEDTLPSRNMFTLDFKRAEGADLFQAEATDMFGEWYEVKGSCSLNVDKTLSFTFSLVNPGSLTEFYSGTFRGTAQSCCGSFGFSGSPDDNHGIFVMSRLPSDMLRWRPAPIVLKDPGSGRRRALWRYAIKANVDRVRKHTMLWSRIRERGIRRRRFIELAKRYRFYGRPLVDAELKEFYTLRSLITPGDARFYISIIARDLQDNPIHPDALCEACDGHIGGSRVICIDCKNPDAVWNPVDLCDDLCIEAEVPLSKRPDLLRPHLPSHTLMKINRVLHVRYLGDVERAAWKSLATAREAFERAGDLEVEVIEVDGGESETNVNRIEVPRCACCLKTVTQPCWYCVACPDELRPFICMECDHAGNCAFKLDNSPHMLEHPLHRRDHALVRVTKHVPMDAFGAGEMRLSSLQESFAQQTAALERRLEKVGCEFLERQAGVDRRLHALENGFTEHRREMDGRMERIEGMMRDMLRTLGTWTVA